MPQLQRRRRHVRDRPLLQPANATGRGGACLSCDVTWQRPLPLDQAQQSVLYPFTSQTFESDCKR